MRYQAKLFFTTILRALDNIDAANPISQPLLGANVSQILDSAITSIDRSRQELSVSESSRNELDWFEYLQQKLPDQLQRPPSAKRQALDQLHEQYQLRGRVKATFELTRLNVSNCMWWSENARHEIDQARKFFEDLSNHDFASEGTIRLPQTLLRPFDVPSFARAEMHYPNGGEGHIKMYTYDGSQADLTPSYPNRILSSQSIYHQVLKPSLTRTLQLSSRIIREAAKAWKQLGTDMSEDRIAGIMNSQVENARFWPPKEQNRDQEIGLRIDRGRIINDKLRLIVKVNAGAKDHSLKGADTS
ncbi:MAG: hypothetical protein Q9200_000612 [Gallowayella weberi]